MDEDVVVTTWLVDEGEGGKLLVATRATLVVFPCVNVVNPTFGQTIVVDDQMTVVSGTLGVEVTKSVSPR